MNTTYLQQTGMGVTALARVIVRRSGAPEGAEVQLERRFATAEAAREWCVATLAAQGLGDAVLEIEVHVENWRARHRQARSGMTIPESVQVGIPLDQGGIRWSTPQLT